MRGLSLAAASGGHSSSRCAGLSLSRPLLLRGTGSRRAGSVVVAHGPGCSTARGIFPDQGSNPCPLHWQADSQPLRHQGSPTSWFLASKLSIEVSFFLMIRGPMLAPASLLCSVCDPSQNGNFLASNDSSTQLYLPSPPCQKHARSWSFLSGCEGLPQICCNDL